MATIFLSYSREDSKVMQQVKEALQDAGVSVWTDEKLTPGTPDWQIAERPERHLLRRKDRARQPVRQRQ